MNDNSLVYLTRKPKIEIANPPLLVMLHGYGSNEQDLFSFAEELPDELFIVSVQAPLSLGFGSYAWYTIHFETADASKFSDIPEAKAALQKINLFLDNIIAEHEVDSKNVFLLGFSQGTILSMAYALNHPEKVQHVVGLSGYIMEELLPKDLAFKNYTHLDFFASHGTVDQVIPVDWARKTTPFLNQLGIANEYHEYPVGHGVAPQNFTDLKNWIVKRL